MIGKMVCMACTVMAASASALAAERFDSATYTGEMALASDLSYVAAEFQVSARRHDSVGFRCRFADRRIEVVFGIGQGDDALDRAASESGWLSIAGRRRIVALEAGPGAVGLRAAESRQVYEAALVGEEIELEYPDGQIHRHNLAEFGDVLHALAERCATDPVN